MRRFLSQEEIDERVERAKRVIFGGDMNENKEDEKFVEAYLKDFRTNLEAGISDEILED